MLMLEDDPGFRRSERLITRFGWIVLALFVVAGLLGLLGAGPLSSTTAGGPDDAVRVEYQRVTHFEADDMVTLLLSEEAVDGDTLTVELTGEWLTGVDLSSVKPQPDAQRTVPGGVVYEFAVEGPSTVEVSMSFRAQKLGGLPMTATAGGSTVSLTQFVLP